MKKYFVIATFVFVLSTNLLFAKGLSDFQVSAILSLLKSFGVEQSVATKVEKALRGDTLVSELAANIVDSVCPKISRNLALGSRGSDVAELQRFLKKQGFYSYPEITGYYGPVTMKAVQAFQRAQGVVLSGDPVSTGFGVFGPKTRSALMRVCNNKNKIDTNITHVINKDDQNIDNTLFTHKNNKKTSEKKDVRKSKPRVINTGSDRCVSGDKTYNKGTKLTCILDGDERKCVADATFMCVSGKWVTVQDNRYYYPRPKVVEVSDAIVDIQMDSVSKRYIKKEVFGLNSIFGYEKDSYWGPEIYSKIFYIRNGGLLRYPGGAVTDFYHWNNVTRPFTDAWDPDQNTSILQDREYMSLDEYLKHAQNLKTTPLIGINMLSGWLFDRESEALVEARELVKRVDQYFPKKRKLYFLGNENYGNHKRRLSEYEYADLFNRYTKEILRTNTQYAKFILNWNNKYWDGNRHVTELSNSWKKLLNKVKNSIDIIDIHTYWGYKVPGETADEKWQSYLDSNEVTGPENVPYTSYLKGLRVALDKAGFHDKKLAVLEWGVLPIRENGIQNDMTAAQIAIIDTDMFMSLLKSDVVDMAAFWPLRWDGPWKLDNFAFLDLNNQITIVNRFLSHFAPLKDGYKILSNASSQLSDVKVLAAIHGSGTKMQIYILNRSEQDKTISINLRQLFKNPLIYKVAGYQIVGDIAGHASQVQWFNDTDKFSINDSELRGTLRPWSLIRIELDLKE